MAEDRGSFGTKYEEEEEEERGGGLRKRKKRRRMRRRRKRWRGEYVSDKVRFSVIRSDLPPGRQEH